MAKGKAGAIQTEEIQAREAERRRYRYRGREHYKRRDYEYRGTEQKMKTSQPGRQQIQNLPAAPSSMTWFQLPFVIQLSHPHAAIPKLQDNLYLYAPHPKEMHTA